MSNMLWLRGLQPTPQPQMSTSEAATGWVSLSIALSREKTLTQQSNISAVQLN